MAQKLSTQLRNHGCTLDTTEFRRILVETKRDLFPDWTDEHLVCTVEEDARDDRIVPKSVGESVCNLPRPFILFQLLNVRKAQVHI